MLPMVGVALCMLLPAGTACGPDAVEGGAVCTFGEVIPCQSDAGCTGERTCLPDLSSYGPCLCPGSDAGSPEAGPAAAGADGGP